MIDASGVASGDYVDRLGHGTAVTAAIKEKAPAAELFPVKVFDLELSTSSAALGHAIDWSASQDARLVNLSLGTANPEHEDALAAAVVRAQEGGALIVSAEGSEGKRWLPGSLPGVVGVHGAHGGCGRGVGPRASRGSRHGGSVSRSCPPLGRSGPTASLLPVAPTASRRLPTSAAQ